MSVVYIIPIVKSSLSKISLLNGTHIDQFGTVS
jgi:hypothetical protein